MRAVPAKQRLRGRIHELMPDDEGGAKDLGIDLSDLGLTDAEGL